MSQAAVAVVVLSVEEAHHLEQSLPAVGGGARVIVVDNACTDATAAVARGAGAEVVALRSRTSYAAAMNAGMATALDGTDADAVLVLNADCTLDPGFLDAALPRLGEDGVGAVAPLVRRAADPATVDAAGMTLDRRRKNGLAGHGEPVRAWASRGGEAFGPDGACALWRASVLRELGPEVFDEELGLWVTDADLAWRARAAGWRTVFEPRATASHVRFYSPSTRVAVPAEHRRLQFRNRLLMSAKDDRAGARLRDAPWLVGYEVAALGHALLRERELLGGYADAWRARPAMRGKRASVGRARVPFGLVAR